MTCRSPAHTPAVPIRPAGAPPSVAVRRRSRVSGSPVPRNRPSRCPLDAAWSGSGYRALARADRGRRRRDYGARRGARS